MHLADGVHQPLEAVDVEHGHVLTGEAHVPCVLAHGRRAHRRGRAQRREPPPQPFVCERVCAHHRRDEVHAQRNAVGDRQTRAQGSPQTDGLAAEARLVIRRCEGDAVAHSTSTRPLVPSTRTLAPSPMRAVAVRVPTTAGIPYSRATIAACES